MDALAEQVIALTHKVDALYQIIRQLQEQIADYIVHPELSDEVDTHSTLSVNPPLTLSPLTLPDACEHLELSLEHKDVLADDNCIESHFYSREPTMTADIQVQRLTAQLTAAYNRIAALEEQLLSKRIHP